MKLEKIIGIGAIIGGIGLAYFKIGEIGYPLIFGGILYTLAVPNDYLNLRYDKENHEENNRGGQ